MILVLFSLFVLIFAFYVIKVNTKPKNFPPGPKWYPFIGCSTIVHKVVKKNGSQFKGFLELAKEYSTQVLGLKLGSELLVVLYGEKNVRQAFMDEAFEGRPTNFFLKLRCLGKRLGITFVDGPLWKIHRQFTLTQLKNVGFKKTLMEKEIQNELDYMLNYLNKNQGKPISPGGFVSYAVMNVLWKYVAGEKIKEERWKHMQELFSKRSKAFSMAGGLLNQYPWCRFIIPNLSGYSLIKNLNMQISDIIEEAIEKHKNNEIDGKDFIYAFLEAEHQETFTEEQLKVVCLDLFIAGSQTTANLLEFAFITMIRNKSIQDKICAEIDNVIGNEVPCWMHSNKLIYTSAFLLELQRHYPIAPLAGPRRVLQDTVVDGYLIPKNTTVLMSVRDIHFNPELWEDPHVFKPERFIDERGLLKNSEHMYPFGLGRRRCPGDSLAKSFLFLSFVGIMQNFKLECVNGTLPSAEPDYGLILSPKPYKAEFKPRKKNITI